MMDNPDEAVEKLLAGLRTAEPLAGMEGRILSAIEQHQLAPHRSRLWLQYAVSRRLLLCGVALSSAILVITAVTAIHRLASPSADTSPRTASVSRRPQTDLPLAAEKQTQKNDAKASTGRPKLRNAAHQRARQAASSHAGKEESFPAPSMPLTEQEKLLLKLAHQGDPQELAMLTHRGAAEQSEEEKAEFRNFFGQPAKGDHK